MHQSNADMRFWQRSTLGESPNQEPEPANLEENTSGSNMVTMMAMKHLEHALDTIVSSVTTPLNNLKSSLAGPSNITTFWYAKVILFVMVAVATLAVLNKYKKSLKTFMRQPFRKFKVNGEPTGNESDEDDDDDDDEDDDEEEESDDSDYSRGRGDRSSKKYYRYTSTSRPSRTRQKRRR